MSASQSQHETTYGQLEIGGDIVIYDVDNHAAWIQSDTVTDREAMA